MLDTITNFLLPEIEQLQVTLFRLSELQRESIDRPEIEDLFLQIKSMQLQNQDELLAEFARSGHYKQPTRISGDLDPSMCPLLGYKSNIGWFILVGINSLHEWVGCGFDRQTLKWDEFTSAEVNDYIFYKFSLQKSILLQGGQVFSLIKSELLLQRKFFLEVILGSIMINIIALATSLYSMQIYDRVIPAGAMQTLFVLTLAVFFAGLFELFAKLIRARVYEGIIDTVDRQLARTVFLRFLSVRLDQMPRSVGSLASQLRGYESIRSFFTSIATQLLVDAPFAIFFIFLMAFFGGYLVLIPLVFLACSLVIGFYFKNEIEVLSTNSTQAANLKTGLLVEAIEGAETIKSGNSGWRILSRWMTLTDGSRLQESEMRHISDSSQHVAVFLQQFSYVALISIGALFISKNQLSMGELIACSILSGRILAPVGMIPGLLVQWSQTKAAMSGLTQIWNLPQDQSHGSRIALKSIAGRYKLENVQFQYQSKVAFFTSNLEIKPGERIGILGPIGAGKTTLLRLLSGMYKPQGGRVLLDSVDIAQIHRALMAESIGYVQQDGRIFSGTLRENLVLGLSDPGDDEILKVASETGLLDMVILPSEKGLEQEILEGGIGLSGGQRQLVNITKIFLKNPKIWLLDEPTASMDRPLELRIIKAIKDRVRFDQTLILVTHKPELLELVDRIIVVAGHSIYLDGDKLEVLAKLNSLGAQ